MLQKASKALLSMKIWPNLQKRCVRVSVIEGKPRVLSSTRARQAYQAHTLSCCEKIMLVDTHKKLSLYFQKPYHKIPRPGAETHSIIAHSQTTDSVFVAV